jgi:hypothetical protein
MPNTGAEELIEPCYSEFPVPGLQLGKFVETRRSERRSSETNIPKSPLRRASSGEVPAGSGETKRFSAACVPAGQSIDIAHCVPLFGYGLGLGTNAGTTRLSGPRAFLLAENEWPRMTPESGRIFGYAHLLLRLWIWGFLIRQAWRALGCGQSMHSRRFGQPTRLGFTVLSTGHSLACGAPTSFAPVLLLNQSKERRSREDRRQRKAFWRRKTVKMPETTILIS